MRAVLVAAARAEVVAEAVAAEAVVVVAAEVVAAAAGRSLQLSSNERRVRAWLRSVWPVVRRIYIDWIPRLRYYSRNSIAGENSGRAISR
jgi:hypothetical protein